MPPDLMTPFTVVASMLALISALCIGARVDEIGDLRGLVSVTGLLQGVNALLALAHVVLGASVSVAVLAAAGALGLAAVNELLIFLARRYA